MEDGSRVPNIDIVKGVAVLAHSSSFPCCRRIGLGAKGPRKVLKNSRRGFGDKELSDSDLPSLLF